MSGMIFHWTVSKGTPPGINNPHARKRIISRWNLMSKAFGLGNDNADGKPNLYCVTNDMTVSMKDAEVNFIAVETLEEALELSKDVGEQVFIEQGGTTLQDFIHPEKAVYVFGCDYGEITSDNNISIDSILPVHSEIAGGIILAHRYLQWPTP